MRQKTEKEWKQMNASIWLVIDTAWKISGFAVNSLVLVHKSDRIKNSFESKLTNQI